MKHNSHHKDFSFLKEPVTFNKFTDKKLLQYCLGATLYMPGTKDILQKILAKSLHPLTSMVMCFEDAIKEEDVRNAEENVLRHLSSIFDAIQKDEISVDDVPLIFLRVRNVSQFVGFVSKLSKEQAEVLTGFVFPKFYSSNADVYLQKLKEINETLGVSLYAMPILEGRSIAYRESRVEELNLLSEKVFAFKELILNIRIGGTDFSSIFGVRRSINTSIYDILPVRDCISDILNFFNRDTIDYTVSAPVWEYFLAYKKDNLEELLQKNINHNLLSRSTIINDAIDGLLREILLDKANGFVGKTIIHPSHIKFVNAMQAVTREEFEDAEQILQTNGGVIKSAKANKMNEINPHRSWAKGVVLRAEAYGVIEDENDYLKLMLS
ncbi:HpcH/HpaI aldolase/citrate lyase family protein [Mongoliibacter ruber]|uniref:Citrate lyase beta subunit n=1 Tax=Mongoliibacter ruber TaxID=1750599 RepID=A0A2T0WPH3_9BACT|nr:HpcH/HpaI aldolase/citrate lyase family protein [Mongoliibacter ruber]PRY88424.1 citrate lyase beta subunit [Mongoliibacter ruber]